MRKINIIAVFCFFSLFACAFAASQYEEITPESVVTEVGEKNTITEKRMASPAEIVSFVKTQLVRTISSFDYNGEQGYRAIINAEVQNYSGNLISDISFVQVLPFEIAAHKIKSDYNFSIVNRNPPIIRFALEKIAAKEKITVSYYIELDESEKQSVEKALAELKAPVALVPLEEKSCLGVSCYSENPCTTSYCVERACVYQNVADGSPCGNGLACVEGACQKFRQTDLWIKLGVVMIICVEISAFTISLVELRKKREKLKNQKKKNHAEK